ncbi:polysaccharide biosynthesis tyrosine autokinase [Chitinispirillales bacterium ANBcel5]|uniref:GumC family protein n=1 Tax=Cellulosispirillum alkaliphilum TaxID=3039283 RepID=UPI002A513CE1|nr:polysaccharide biosynthesis tyrosine autokinase [Chitinispirillales bacterium ANBcel5]
MTFRNTGNQNKFQLDHFIHLVRRYLWFILPLFTVVMALWVFFAYKMGAFTPELEATAILRFDDPQNLSAVDDRVGYEVESRAVLVKSRTLLEEVARKLSLQLLTNRVSREEVFDSLRVGIEAPLGKYQIDISGSDYKIFYSNSNAGIRNRVVAKGAVADLDSLVMPGVYLSFAQRYREDPYTVQFTIMRLRDAVDYILTNLDVNVSEPVGSVLSITMAGQDYPLIKRVVNTIANDFVRENSSSKKGRRGEILTVLEKQLEIAKGEMKEAERALQNFRNQNPTVGLPDATMPPSVLSDLQENEAALSSYINQANSLMERYRNTSSRELLPILSEMVAFLASHGAGTAPGLQSELNYLSEQERIFQREYSPSHPLAIENRNKIRDLGSKISSALNTLTSDLARRRDENARRINSIHSNLAALPAQEIEYANLTRQYEVNAEIYATVLSRYNEAKIAKNIEMGDVYVLDYAVEPEGVVDFRTLIMIFGAGFLFSMTAGLGPVLTIDHFDRKARTEKDLQRLTPLLLLESIPVKGKWEQGINTTEGGEIDSKLMAADYSHNYVDETYRSLRAKILLSLFEEKRKRILITSLNMGEGKSFTASNLAITMAQQNLSTLLVDGDMRRGTQHRTFGLDKKPGLSNILMDRKELDRTNCTNLLRPSHISNLSILSSGVSVPNSAELLNSSRFRLLLDLLGEHFEVIIMDTPPLGVTTDAVGVQNSFHKYIVVVRAGYTNIAHLNRKVGEYPGLRKKVLGLVFNGAPYRRSPYYQYNSYRY